MGAVGLVFAPLAPLVAVAAAVVFWMSSCVYKYQLMFVFVTKVESGGVRIFLLPQTLYLRLLYSSAHLERRDQSPTILRSSYASSDDLE
jgi:hypothetical protein